MGNNEFSCCGHTKLNRDIETAGQVGRGSFDSIPISNKINNNSYSTIVV